MSATSYFVSGEAFSTDSYPYLLPSFLFAVIHNNTLVLSQTHTKSGGVSFACKGLWLTLVTGWVCITCFACRLDTSSGMQGELSVCNPPAPDVCSLISQCDSTQIIIEKRKQAELQHTYSLSAGNVPDQRQC